AVPPAVAADASLLLPSALLPRPPRPPLLPYPTLFRSADRRHTLLVAALQPDELGLERRRVGVEGSARADRRLLLDARVGDELQGRAQHVLEVVAGPEVVVGSHREGHVVGREAEVSDNGGQ